VQRPSVTGGAVQTSAGTSLRVAVVGASVRPTCGVRDHATLLMHAMSLQDVSPSLHWLTREQSSLPAARAEFSAWTRRLSRELDEDPPDAVLMHYSVFSYSHRGLPVFVHQTLRALHPERIPLLVMMHELVYPWRYSGLRGDLWALTQRALLIDVMRACRGAIVTADARERWLTSRVWLPTRRVLVAPVFSNLPAPSAQPALSAQPAPSAQLASSAQPALSTQPAGEHSGATIGLFGYSYEGASLSLVLDALDLLRERGVPAQLRLLGAPGSSSDPGRAWLAAARDRGLESLISFSERLPAQEMSDALAACDVLLFPDAAGPSSRKGSLAGALASGSAVVALNGPNTWQRLLDAQAACVVAPTPAALAQAIGDLLGDEQARAALGARGCAFAADEMGLARSVDAVMGLLDELVSARRE
jgi:glycosyltransferase involved in cell wall biosynthesis